jgi:hypothetical protein
VADTTIVGENVDIVQTGAAGWASWHAVSWSAVIAGAFTAIAVSVILIALGSGIGFAVASPFSSSPSAGTMTVIGAVWLVFSQAVGFAAGGYIAGRLRRDPAPVRDSETKFRDGANGLIVWAIGVVVGMLLLAAATEKIGNAAATAAAGTGLAVAANPSQSMDYFTDLLLRTGPTPAAKASSTAEQGTTAAENTPSANNNPPAANNGPAMNNGTRAQVGRILVTSMGPNGLNTDDRAYLAQIVSDRTGMSKEDSEKRVDDVINRARAAAEQAADTARKAAAYVAFWTFMSLLFGAACATLGGILGGELRDEFRNHRLAPTAPR